MSDAPFCYVVVHQACKNRPGVLAAQVWHAARECMQPGSGPASCLERVCVLEAKSSAELIDLAETLAANAVHHVLLREPDEPWNGTATAVGIDACDRAIVKPLVAQFQLLR